MWNNYLSRFNHWRSVKRPSARYVCSPLEGKAPNPGRDLQKGLTGFGQTVIPLSQVCFFGEHYFSLSFALMRLSRCGDVRGLPEVSSHSLPFVAPQVGQGTVSPCFELAFFFHGKIMLQTRVQEWSILTRVTHLVTRRPDRPHPRVPRAVGRVRPNKASALVRSRRSVIQPGGPGA
jgi:hypothetical protein